MIIEPGKQERKLKSYLDEGIYKKVLIVAWHGVGDTVMLMAPFDVLKKTYPDIHFDLGLCKGLDEETIYPEAVLLTGPPWPEEKEGYDLTALIHFPVEVPGLTKVELCCRDELGIDPPLEYKPLPKFPNKLVAVHFCLTCLPGLANPSQEVAEKIWNEIRKKEAIPIEVHFSHVFDNPQNKIFPFIDCTVRKCVPRISSLIGLIQSCAAFVGVVSGPFHCAVASLPHEKIIYLEKDIPLERFVKDGSIKKIDIKNYKDGQVFEHLKSMGI